MYKLRYYPQGDKIRDNRRFSIEFDNKWELDRWRLNNDIWLMHYEKEILCPLHIKTV